MHISISKPKRCLCGSQYRIRKKKTDYAKKIEGKDFKMYKISKIKSIYYFASKNKGIPSLQQAEYSSYNVP